MPSSSHAQATDFIRGLLRRKHIELLVKDRYGHLTEQEGAYEVLLSIGECSGSAARGRRKSITAALIADALWTWCATWAPTLSQEAIGDIPERVEKLNGWLPHDDHIGQRLRLSHADRERLKITTIGCFDLDPIAREDQRLRKKRERDKERARSKRASSGALSRQEYLAKHSLSRTKPWEVKGISKATYYRRLKRD